MPTNIEIEISVKVILWTIAVITAIGGGSTVVIKLFSPWRTIRDKVNKHDELLAKDKKSIEAHAIASKLQLKAMMLLIDNQLTGNSIDKLKEMKAEINNYLIEK